MIKSISIKKFRGFQNVKFDLGSSLTVIAGQNGTQKTTLLGVLSQPFSITDKEHSLYGEKPLSGGSFKSAFAEKFKLSDTFDKAKSHEWTLHLKDQEEPFVLESINRKDKKIPNTIRFWRKGDRSKGSGYIQLPVIYLSLKRLLPIGEDDDLSESSEVILDTEEITFYKEWHNKILISLDELKDANYLSSKQKNTLGINTDHYDWKQNSAGQDNIGKILLAILSFRRLQDRYKSSYQGGILAIDEIDATLYPASQIKLIDAFRKFSSKFKIQIILTTHSFPVLERACEIQEDKRIKDQCKVVFLEKINNKIKINSEISYEAIMHRLNLTLSGTKLSKINVFSEDKEANIFIKAILKTTFTKYLKFHDCTFGCGNLIELASKHTPGFKFPDSLIFLDGDVRKNKVQHNKSTKIKNILLLPGSKSPEQEIANFLYKLDDESPVWANINETYTKQYCFKDYTLVEINSGREKSKEWFNLQLPNWGRNASKVINPWISDNQEVVDEFKKEFKHKYNQIANEVGGNEI